MKSKATHRHLSGLLVLALAAAAGVLSGCLASAPKAVASSTELPFDEAVAQAADGLVAQTQKLPAFLARVEAKLNKRGVVLDPMLDAASGQQTNATQLLERRVAERMTSKFDNIEILPFQSANLSRAQYLLTGTMTRSNRSSGQRKSALQINLALTELKNGQVVAQSSAVARDDALDHTPLRVYQDSPVLVKDKVIEGYVATSATPPGRAADSYYFDRVAVATVISDANALYNAERYQESLARYREAGGLVGGDQLRTLNGIYLANAKLGRAAEAETAFGNIVAYGLKFSQLDVKFLFNPGSTGFWSDPRVSGAYGMWLRQIAKEAGNARVCMKVVGHTSRTGSEQTNDALSLQRATVIQQRLAAESPAVAGRVKPSGMGFRENIVGSGSDNAVDALDRRVEFKVEPCPGA